MQDAPAGASHSVLVEQLKKQPDHHFHPFLSILHKTGHTYVARRIERSFNEYVRGTPGLQGQEQNQEFGLVEA